MPPNLIDDVCLMHVKLLEEFQESRISPSRDTFFKKKTLVLQSSASAANICILISVFIPTFTCVLLYFFLCESTFVMTV